MGLVLQIRDIPHLFISPLRNHNFRCECLIFNNTGGTLLQAVTLTRFIICPSQRVMTSSSLAGLIETYSTHNNDEDLIRKIKIDPRNVSVRCSGRDSAPDKEYCSATWYARTRDGVCIQWKKVGLWKTACSAFQIVPRRVQRKKRRCSCEASPGRVSRGKLIHRSAGSSYLGGNVASGPALWIY